MYHKENSLMMAIQESYGRLVCIGAQGEEDVVCGIRKEKFEDKIINLIIL